MSQVITESPVVRRCDDQDQGSQASGNKVKLYNKGTLNNVDLSTAHKAQNVVSGLITINSVLTTVLFNPRSTHCFISSKYAAAHRILRRPMGKPMLVKSQNKKLRATHQCPNVNLNIKGASFEVNLIVLDLLEIDVVLDQGWSHIWLLTFASSCSLVIRTSAQISNKFHVTLFVINSLQNSQCCLICSERSWNNVGPWSYSALMIL
jgi:hypothetical protein